MALIPLRRDWTSKPPVGTPLRTDGHWSVQGLYSAYIMQAGSGTCEVDLVSGLPTVSSLGSPQLSVDGLIIPGASNRINTARPIINSTDEYWSYVSKLSWSPADSNTWYSSCKNDGDVNTDCGLILRELYTGLKWSMVNYNSVYFGDFGGPYSQTAGTHTWTVTKAGSGKTHKGYKDGYPLLAAAYGSVTEYHSVWTYFKGIGSNFTGCGTSSAKIDFILAYHRTLPDAEVASISANPYQIFEPEIVWVEVGSGEPSPIYLDAVVAGSSILAAQLSTAIRMAASITGTGAVSGLLATIISLSADIIGSAAVGADLHTAIRLAASLAGSTISTAQLATAIRLQAGISATSATAAALATSIRLSAAIAGQATTSASLFIDNLAELGAVIAGSSTVQANLSTAIRMAADLHGESATTADISTILQLAAAIHGNTATTAQLTTAINLQASITGRAALTAALTSVAVALAHSLCISISARSAAIQITARAASIEVTHDHC